MSQPNIDYMMNMTKDFLNGKIDDIAYTLDDDYCELIYESLYEEGIALYNDLSDAEFKKLIRKQYNYIKKIAKEGFY